MIYVLLLLFLSGISCQDPPVLLLNNTAITITTDANGGYYNYTFPITESMIPVSVNILLEGVTSATSGQIFASFNSSVFCTYNQYPTNMQYCVNSGWSGAYSLISLNFDNVNTLAIAAYLQTPNAGFNIKVLAYPLMQVFNGSSIDINSLDSVHGYVFSRFYKFIHSPSLAESLFVIVEGSGTLDFASLYFGSNCTNRVYNPFPSSVNNIKGTRYSDKSMFLQLNLEPTPCEVSINVAVSSYTSGLNMKVLTYGLIPLSNNSMYTIDSLNSTSNYYGFYRYFSFLAKSGESPGGLNVVVNGITSTDQARVYAKTGCSEACTFSYFPELLNNCFYTAYSNPFQILTVTYDSLCSITIGVLVDSFNQGITIQAVVYPVITLKNNTYSTIYPINDLSSTQAFWRYFYYSSKIVASVNILLEGATTQDLGGAYAKTDCDGGCAYSNFPSKASSCYRKYEGQNTFVLINLETPCNISIGVYITQLPVSMKIKVMAYPTFLLPNGIPILIDALGSAAAFENLDRYFSFKLKDSDSMGNLSLVLEGISTDDNSQMMVAVDCLSTCTYHLYPNSNSYCYQTTYNNIGKLQINLASACTVIINTHLFSYRFGYRLTATYYNICPDKITNCTTCNSTLDSNNQAVYQCFACKNYYAPNPDNYLNCQLCNQTVGYFVDYTNNGYCSICQDNCFNCSNYQSCIQCKSGYILNKISSTTSNCQCSVANCSSCDSSGKCQLCNQGFGLYSQDNLCLACLLDSCEECSFDSNFVPSCDLCSGGKMFSQGSCKDCNVLIPNCSKCLDNNTCQACLRGTYLSTQGKCISCGDLYTKGCTDCYSDYTCSSCIYGYYLNNENYCRSCSSLFPNCDECVLQDCVKCSEGYWYNITISTCVPCFISNCSQCSDPNICDSCGEGFTLSNNTCQSCNNGTNLSQCITCDLGGSKNTCLACFPTWYMTENDTCQTCFSISASCIDCVNNTYCNSCLYTSLTQTYLYQNPGDPSSRTCVASCPDGSLLNNTSLSCDPCVNFYGHGCQNCSSTQCLLCGSEEPYFYGNSCSACNGSNQQPIISSNNYCLDVPYINFANLTKDGIFLNIQVNCSVQSQVYFIYGLLTSTDSDTFDSVSSVTSIVPTTDFLYDWKGKGMSPTDASGYLNLTINGPFKNIGDLYKMKLWCQFSNNWGSLKTNATTLSWTQYDNGAKIVKVRVNTSSYVSFNKKAMLAKALQQALQTSREIYTENNIPSSSFTASRLLQFYLLDQSRSLVNYVYSYDFSIVPDYKVAHDYMEDLVNSSIQNSTLFSSKLKTYVSKLDSTSAIDILDVSYVGVMKNPASIQGFFSNYPAFSVQNTTIFLKYILKNEGNLYVGVQKADGNTLSVNSKGIANVSLLWSDFKNRLDWAGNQLTLYNIYPSQPTILLTLNYSDLQANTTYYLIVGAGNLALPENTTEITVAAVQTGWTVTNTSTGTFGERVLSKVWVILIILALLIFGI